MVRGVLFVFFASFMAVENNVNLLLISITSPTILLYTSFTGRLYKTTYSTILENLCFLNLAMLGIGTFYIRVLAAGGNQETLITASVGFAFLQFCGITIVHSYRFVIAPIRQWYAKVRANYDRSIDNAVQLQPLLNSDSSSDDDSLEYMPRNEVTHTEICVSQLREEQDPSNPTTSAEHRLQPPDMINTTCRSDLINFDTHHADVHPITGNEANKCSPNNTEATMSVPSHHLPPPSPSDTYEGPRYFAAEREERYVDFNAPRETLLEYTQYRLPQERNEPARDSTAERELLSAPHEHPQESSEPRYFAAEREGPIDFTAPRESLLDYTQ